MFKVQGQLECKLRRSDVSPVSVGGVGREFTPL